MIKDYIDDKGMPYGINPESIECVRDTTEKKDTPEIEVYLKSGNSLLIKTPIAKFITKFKDK